MTQDPSGFPIASGDLAVPDEVPFTDKPGGKRVSTAKLTEDERGVIATVKLPGEVTSDAPAGRWSFRRPGDE